MGLDVLPRYFKISVVFSRFRFLITARNSSCGKVMFSQTCVIPSVQTPPLPDMATEVCGMHPTGMHSCYMKFFLNPSSK